ncbi:hypothetical protein SEUCBS139899_001847 [Sporothrix eucalyptigena]
MITQDAHNASTFAESRTTTVTVVSIVFASISLGMLLLRLYLRCRVLKASGLDDWTMLIAQMLAIVVSVATVLETKYGLGRHVWGIASKNEINQLNYLYINIILYNLTMNVIKISFLLQYYRIFHSDRIRNICFCMMVTSGWCLHTLPIWYFSSAMNIVTDAAIFLIPLPSVVRLQLPPRQKIVILFVFCLGFGVCAISVARALTLRSASDTHDPTWDNTDAAIWSVVEMNCAILCSSVPTLRPLFARKLSGLKSTLSRTTTRRGRSHSRSRSRSITTPRTADEEVGMVEHDPMPELHLVDLEELARRSSHFHAHSRSHSQSQTPKKKKPRPDTGVFTTVERGSSSSEGFEKLLAQMAGEGGEQTRDPSRPPTREARPQIVVTTKMSIKGPEDGPSP